MKSRFVLAGAVTALAIAMSPAAQSSVSSPFNKWKPDGLGCGFVGVNTDPTNPQGTHMEGEIDCEAVWTPNTTPPTGTVGSAQAQTWIQTGTPNYTGGTVLSSCPVSLTPSTAIAACPISFDIARSTPSWFCVRYTWIEDMTTYVQEVDADAVTAGKQCERVNSICSLVYYARREPTTVRSNAAYSQVVCRAVNEVLRRLGG